MTISCHQNACMMGDLGACAPYKPWKVERKPRPQVQTFKLEVCSVTQRLPWSLQKVDKL